jgi:hypothetical protein
MYQADARRGPKSSPGLGVPGVTLLGDAAHLMFGNNALQGLLDQFASHHQGAN